jgi:hypothetical protein
MVDTTRLEAKQVFNIRAAMVNSVYCNGSFCGLTAESRKFGCIVDSAIKSQKDDKQLILKNRF